MPPPPRKIANRYVNGPQRYRSGKPAAAETSSDEEDEDEDEQQDEAPPPPKVAAAKPTATSFPKAALKPSAPQVNEDDFETEESEDGGGGSEAGSDGSASGSGEEEDSSSEEESSSEDEAAKRRVMMRPMFVKKDKRNGNAAAAANGSSGTAGAQAEEQRLAEEETRRRERADELVQAQIDKNAAAKAAGKKFWDDEDVELIDDIDDTDDVDPEAEYAAWKLRELKRVKRDREALIAAEKEREEVERRRNLGEDERKAEDDEFLARQREERDSRNKMDYMQKYYHKGAFFQDDAKAMGLDKRDVMGSRYENQIDRSVLPEYLQVRDMTRVGRKGRTKYKDMRSEDTGRWGEFGERRGGGYQGQDERFMPDRDRDKGAERTGANASALGERKRHVDDDGREGKRPRVDP